MIGNAVNFKSVTGATNWIINDRINYPLLQASSPYYFISVENVDGLFSRDISYESHPIPHTDAEFSGDVYRLGQTITLSGKIYGNNVAKLYEASYFLERMFNETGKRALMFRPWNHLGSDVFKMCRVNQDLNIVETFESGKHEWDWVVGLRSDNGLTYSATNTVWTGA